MKNRDVFTIKRVLNNIQEKKIENVDFAFQLIELESKIDTEIELIQKVIQNTVKWSDKDKLFMDEQQKLKQIFNDVSVSDEDKKKELDKFNSDYDKEFLKQFTEKNNKVEDILDKTNGKKYPSISKSELPEGLTLSDYKALSSVTK